jgi:hypothetical protein
VQFSPGHIPKNFTILIFNMKTISKGATVILLLLLMFFIIDGFSDTLLFVRYKVQTSLNEKKQDAQIQMLKSDYDRIQYRSVPDVGKIPIQGNYGEYHIGSEGQRLVPDGYTKSPKKKLLILGASPTFGYLNSDTRNFGAFLAKYLPEYKIDNFSIAAQSPDKNLANWKRLSNLGYHYDLAIIVNGPVDFYLRCLPPMPVETESDAQGVLEQKILSIHYMIKISLGKLSSLKDDHLSSCQNQDFADLVTEQTKMAYQNLLTYGKQEKTETLIFIQPTPYGEYTNVSNLESDQTFMEIRPIMNKMFYDLLSEIRGMDRVIDLSTLFDNRGPLFIDMGAHFKEEGAEIFARKVAEKIREREPQNEL